MRRGRSGPGPPVPQRGGGTTTLSPSWRAAAGQRPGGSLGGDGEVTLLLPGRPRGRLPATPHRGTGTGTFRQSDAAFEWHLRVPATSAPPGCRCVGRRRSERSISHQAVPLAGPPGCGPGGAASLAGPSCGDRRARPEPGCALEPSLQLPARAGAANSPPGSVGACPASLVPPHPSSVVTIPRSRSSGPRPHGNLEALTIARVGMEMEGCGCGLRGIRAVATGTTPLGGDHRGCPSPAAAVGTGPAHSSGAGRSETG